jgi:AcrR family transcriptional regulator
MAVSIKMKLNEHLYLRDPQETKLGQKIIKHSILMIEEMGFEEFTFKKLATEIESTEASIYRYFENKHRLLLFLLSWYWEWVKYCVELKITNIDDPKRKLKLAIETIVKSAREDDPNTDFVDEAVLHRIVVAESAKGYYTKMVDEENRQGLFLTYKALNQTLVTIIEEINPKFPYPRSLGSTLLEMAKSHVYFSEHLPSLTDIKVQNENGLEEVIKLLEAFAFGLLVSPVFEQGERKHHGAIPFAMNGH